MKNGPKTHHVTFDRKRKQWKVQKGGADRASSLHDTKKQAVDTARKVSRNQRTELRIHNKDGRIAQSDSHGHDPKPPKG